MLWLLVAAVLSCTSFMAYGAMIESWPLILLPINLWRLIELRRTDLQTEN